MNNQFKIVFVLIIALAALLVGIYRVGERAFVAPNVITSQPLKSENPDTAVVIDPNESESKTVSMIAVGDIMLDRTVENKIRAHNDINYPFLKVTDFLKSADFVFGNLECPITPDDPNIIQANTVFNAKPGMEVALKNAGIAIVNLANNHTMNYGEKGMINTLKYLDEVGIVHVGSGKNSVDAAAPAFVEQGGIKFAFLGYTDTDVLPPGYPATTTKPGNNIMDVSKMRQAVQNVRGQADIVVVTMHSGTEYEKVNPRQITFAHAAIDSGADVVIGGHSHVLQKIEEYNGKYIFYSLGNFVFDQMWSVPTTQSIIAKLTFDKNGLVQGEMTPVIIKDYSQPEIVDDQELAKKILDQLEFPLNNVKYLK
jgi:poly-gamma-glutamate capsule biosynthesis protein CapA/YwtB (metallophosphatase superfamily)